MATVFGRQELTSLHRSIFGHPEIFHLTFEWQVICSLSLRTIRKHDAWASRLCSGLCFLVVKGKNGSLRKELIWLINRFSIPKVVRELAHIVSIPISMGHLGFAFAENIGIFKKKLRLVALLVGLFLNFTNRKNIIFLLLTNLLRLFYLRPAEEIELVMEPPSFVFPWCSSFRNCSSQMQWHFDNLINVIFLQIYRGYFKLQNYSLAIIYLCWEHHQKKKSFRFLPNSKIGAKKMKRM